MDHVYRKMRLVTVGVVAAASVVAGMVAFWYLAPREVMAKTPTSMYLIVLAMLAGPIVTIVAWAWDRRARIQDELAAQETRQEHVHVANRLGSREASVSEASRTAERQAAAGAPQSGGVMGTGRTIPARRALPGNRHRVVRHVVK
ncbi:hypothetical protein [Limnofasciculus baicalensis]|uniref:hypothetical protein n=1 Tax=Limnofasciculus baicalensis TaxID=3064906 RepID=UPI0020A7966D|nr:hypothetical protein [Limnofasciculus baicalensis]